MNSENSQDILLHVYVVFFLKTKLLNSIFIYIYCFLLLANGVDTLVCLFNFEKVLWCGSIDKKMVCWHVCVV